MDEDVPKFTIDHEEKAAIRFAAFDLDGTLLNQKGDLLSDALEGIRTLVESRINPIIVTGRTVAGINNLELPETFLAMFDTRMLCNDGNVIYDRIERTSTYRNVLSSDILLSLRDRIFDCRDYVIESNSQHAAFTKKAALQFCMMYKLRRNQVAIRDPSELFPNITRIVLFPEGAMDMDGLESKFACRFSQSQYFNAINIVPANTCKAEGLSWYLKERFGASGLDQVISFGDGPNDSMLLRKCRIGVAVRDSHPNAVQSARIHLRVPIGEYIVKHFARLHEGHMS